MGEGSTPWSPHRFVECPGCGGKMKYPTQSDVVCSECSAEYCHEIREGENVTRHLLWTFDADYRLDEVIARA